jgi:hypothetical protein
MGHRLVIVGIGATDVAGDDDAVALRHCVPRTEGRSCGQQGCKKDSMGHGSDGVAGFRMQQLETPMDGRRQITDLLR